MAKRSATIGSGARRWLAGALLAAAGALAATPAGAVSISLAPASVSPAPGDSFTLELLVSGLGDGTAPSLGAFDITLSFDPTAVAFSSVSFDAFLGAIPAEATADALAGPGTLALAEFSVLSSSALDALQPGSFRLATLVFAAAGATPSTIAVTSALLGDGEGARIGLDAPLGSTRVAPIPEPAAALAFGLGVAVVARASRRRGAR